MTNGNKVLTFYVEAELSLFVSVPIPATRFVSNLEAFICAYDGNLNYVSIFELGFLVCSLDDYLQS